MNLSSIPDQNKQTSILVFCAGHSTRYLFNVSIPGKQYRADFAWTTDEVIKAAAGKKYDIYFLDGVERREESAGLAKKIAEMKLPHLVRIIVLTETAPGVKARMTPAGPVGLLEIYFSRERLMESVREIMEMKDTGSRVKSDEKYFDVTILKKN